MKMLNTQIVYIVLRKDKHGKVSFGRSMAPKIKQLNSANGQEKLEMIISPLNMNHGR